MRIHVVGKVSWKKEKLERAVGKNEKLESSKLESFRLSWKAPIEVGKFSMQYKVIIFLI